MRTFTIAWSLTGLALILIVILALMPHPYSASTRKLSGYEQMEKDHKQDSINDLLKLR